MTTLWDTTGREVVAALSAERRSAGAVATGLVLSLVATVPERTIDEAVAAATEAAQAHPCRVIVVVRRAPDAPHPRLDAEVSIGGRHGAAETVILRMEGRLALHAESVVLPLLAPDTPVMAWWAGEPPQRTAHDPLGALASRRVTDTAAAADPLAALLTRARDHHPGDTDLAWARTSAWRAVLASALDPGPLAVQAVRVSAAPADPSGVLLAAWLGTRLEAPASVAHSRGPGITEVVLEAPGETVVLSRPDGRTATLSRPGQGDRVMPLPQRDLADLLAEELRRLGDDEVYAEALAACPPLMQTITVPG
ncbi:MAG: glucose-6-phosphate dehydrogenase assembly protein OpcA [Mycobacteriales bacterium]